MSRSVVQRCCVCGHEVRIESSKIISDKPKLLYCGCKDPTYGHTWVTNLDFSHTLSPSALKLPEELREKVKAVPPAQQQNLFGGVC